MPAYRPAMCTLVLLHRPDAAWKLLLAANRDEMLARPWQPPAAHWPAQPDIIGGRDCEAGGTWLALREDGMVAGVLNRTGALGPAPGKRSRGELPLMALRAANADALAAEAACWDAGAWRPFNLVVADTRTALFLRGRGAGPVEVVRLPPGLTMVTAADPNDPTHPRVARHLPRFAASLPPSPPNWGAWPGLLADSGGAWAESLNVPPRQGFGTASAALIAARDGEAGFWFAAGAPGRAPFAKVAPGGGDAASAPHQSGGPAADRDSNSGT